MAAEVELATFPIEIWQTILSLLDLASQVQVCRVSKDFSSMVTSIWRVKVAMISRHLDLGPWDGAQEVRLKLVLSSMLKDHGSCSVDLLHRPDLYRLLDTHLRLSSGGEKVKETYDFFHDYHKTGMKWLDLTQKWPRPGAKSLARFSHGNPDLVYLSVSDCRENIEAVHHLTSHCHQLEGLRLLATDPLMPYTEVLKLKNLRYLEVQFDSFYRDHRDDFIHCLGRLPCLQVLKLITCYGLTDSQVISLLTTSTNSLVSLHLPYNSKIRGWFLETLLTSLTPPPSLLSLHMTINTAYIDLTSVVPQLHARNLQKQLQDKFNIRVGVDYVHHKLPSFNPKENS